MAKKSNSSLRGPVHQPDSFKRFLSENVKKTPTKLPAVPGDAAPLPERVTPQDLIRQSGRPAIRPGDVVRPGSPVATESGGALLRPQYRRRYSPEVVNSPAPFVHSSPDLTAHTFTAAGSGKRIVPGPVKAPVTSSDIIRGSK